MANRKRTPRICDLMAKNHLDKTEKAFVSEADTLGLLDDYTFITAYRNYKKQLELMSMLLEDIEKKRANDEDIDKEVGRYNQSGGQADKFLTKIRAIIADRRKEQLEKDNNPPITL